jgi:YD repeat-containing protein
MRFSRAAETLYDAALTHDAAGRMIGVEGTSGPDALKETYEHNALGQLTRFSRQQGVAATAWEYEADVDGNLLRSAEMQTAQFEYDFTRPGALTRRTLDDTTIETFVFDTAGHMTDWGASVLEWDARGRLVRMAKPDGTVAEMTYDYRGARVAKRITNGAGSTLTRYIDELYEDRAGVGNSYVFAAGRLVGRVGGGGQRPFDGVERG